MSNRTFHLGDLLSVTTGRLVAPGQMAGVHEFLDYLTSDTLMTHQLTRACGEAAPVLLARYPQLATVEVPENFAGEADVLSWLAHQISVHGEWFQVSPLNAADHTVINPLEELALRWPHLTVITVETPEAGDQR